MLVSSLVALALAQATPSIVGDWTSKDQHYTFNEKGEYLANWGMMDHQGTYRIEGRRVFITPVILAQRPTQQFQKELVTQPERFLSEDRPLAKRLARPYVLLLSADGQRLSSIVTIRRDPKAKPLF